MFEMVKSFEKKPGESKKVFCYLVAIGVQLVISILSVVLKADPMLAGVLVTGVTTLAGYVVLQQQKVDTAVRVAALEAAKPE